MRILIAGSNKEYAIERIYYKWLKQMGAEIYLYESADHVLAFYAKSLINKLLFRSFINRNYRKVNRELLRQVDLIKPDLVWVFKGMEIYPASLIAIKKPGVKLVNFNPDHPFVRSSYGSGNRNVTKAIPCYDLHFCYSTAVKARLETEFKLPAVMLPFGFELSESQFNKTLNYPELNKICFLGNPDKLRVNTILLLSENGLKIDVYGNGWANTKLAGNASIGINDSLFGQEFWNILRQYRVQLNIFRAHNIGSHNMRTFEIGGVGGIQLTPYSVEQAAFFQENCEVFFYKNEEELVNKCHFLLSISAEEAMKIRNSVRNRSLTSGYSYKERSLTVWETFNKRQW